MANARHHRNGRCRDGARQGLVVEGHEVLVGTAAAHEQDDVRCGICRPRGFEALDDAGRRICTLDGNAADEELAQRIATTQGADDVMHRLATR